MGKNETNKPKVTKDAAVAGLGEDVRKWLESWEADGWHVDISEKDDLWFAEKHFEGDDGPESLAGFSSLSVLLNEIERIEARRKKSVSGGEEPEESDETEAAEFTPESKYPNVVREWLPVRLSEQEQLFRAKKRSQLVQEIAAAESTFKAAKEDHKAKVGGLLAQISTIDRQVATGIEYRDVNCREEFRPADGKVDIIRMDTDEKIGEREMTSKEFQRFLPGAS